LRISQSAEIPVQLRRRPAPAAFRGLALPPAALLALALALALLAVAALGAPTAGAQPVPWGAGCAPAVPGARTSSSCGAELLEDGKAAAPAFAPAIVKRVIAAANELVHQRYRWGGGHLSFNSRGYDCSGAVSYALHGGGLLGTTMVSGQLESWGTAGIGRWITVYANPEHVYMVVAGLRFDTRSDPPGVSGPRWHMAAVQPRGFRARHPAAL
jgi:cell wall-associated NlpC family hydrolase